MRLHIVKSRLLQNLKQAGVVVGPEGDFVRGGGFGIGGAVDGGGVHDLFVAREHDPGAGVKPPFFVVFFEIDDGRFVIEFAGEVEDDGFKVEEMIGDVDDDDAVGFNVALVECEGFFG